MPPDVFFVLASSGLTLVASLMFFVSNETPPAVEKVGAGDEVAFCLPPVRAKCVPPPLPLASASTSCQVAFTSTASMTLRTDGDEWVVTLDVAPLADAPAMQVNGDEVNGAVHDLRWHGKAGVPRSTRHQWKQTPAKA